MTKDLDQALSASPMTVSALIARPRADLEREERLFLPWTRARFHDRLNRKATLMNGPVQAYPRQLVRHGRPVARPCGTCGPVAASLESSSSVPAVRTGGGDGGDDGSQTTAICPYWQQLPELQQQRSRSSRCRCRSRRSSLSRSRFRSRFRARHPGGVGLGRRRTASHSRLARRSWTLRCRRRRTATSSRCRRACRSCRRSRRRSPAVRRRWCSRSARFVISNAGTAGGAADWIVNDIKIGNRLAVRAVGRRPG